MFSNLTLTVLPVTATTRDQAIRELVAALPQDRLPAGVRRDLIASQAIAREDQISTDLGNGIAIPHSRCPGLESPLVVVGKCPDGVVYAPEKGAPVRLIFLLVTPVERPETQLALLGQLAKVAGSEPARAALFRASVVMGAIAEQADVAQLARLRQFGATAGLAFQIVDDILDVESSSAALGKTAGKDAAQKKVTYPALYGVERSRQMASDYLAQAKAALEPFGVRADTLRELADRLVFRKS